MKRTGLATALAIAALTWALPGTSWAQDKGKPPATKSDGKKVKNYDFSADNIKGELIRPEGVDIDTKGWAQYSSLIKIRTDFIAEILKSAEDL